MSVSHGDFHFTFTVSTLLQHQTDIHEYGRLFSYALIYAFNVLGIALWVVLTSSATLEQMIELFSGHMADIARWLARHAAPIVAGLRQ